MKRAALLAAAIAVALAIAVARGGGPVARSLGKPAGEGPGEAAPAALRAAGAPDDQVTRQEQRVVEAPLPPGAEAAFTALGAHLGRAAAASQALAEARAGRLGAADLRRRLREESAGHPELGSGLLRELAAERTPGIALALAQALAGLQDDDRVRRETVEVLTAAPEAREVGLLALQGRDDLQALRLAADTLAKGTPEARATAAFVLNRAPAPPPEDALASAREALSDPRSGARLREEAATLLGRPGALPGDLALLERLVFEGEPAVQMRALAAIDVGGGADRLPAIVDRVLRERGAPERLLEMARAWRAAHP